MVLHSFRGKHKLWYYTHLRYTQTTVLHSFRGKHKLWYYTHLRYTQTMVLHSFEIYTNYSITLIQDA